MQYNNTNEDTTDSSQQSENNIYEDLSSSDNEEENKVINNNNISKIELIRKLVDTKIKYENDMKKIKDYTKTLKNKIDTINKQLIPLMKQEDVSFININKDKGGGKIKYNKVKTYSAISKKCLNNLLPIFFKEKNINIDFGELIKFLYNNREFKESEKLTKTNK
tara:strand:+ start:2027 stop:2518 length:492 start_codon:yes stop_codon:yes gene_type:complete